MKTKIEIQAFEFKIKIQGLSESSTLALFTITSVIFLIWILRLSPIF